jgi:hypothetical protein
MENNKEHKEKINRKQSHNNNTSFNNFTHPTDEKHAECDHVKKGSEPKKQRSRLIKYIKINI